MFVLKTCLVFLGLFASEALTLRLKRSPDKMEVNIPNQNIDRESGEYQENMNEEITYWQGQGDKIGDKGQEEHDQLDQNRENEKENYEHEKDHYQEQQQEFNKEMNETSQCDRDKAEAHHHDNQEHMHTHYDNYQPGNRTDDIQTDTETVDRYEEKGTEYVNDREDQMENWDMEANAPSIDYSRE